MGLQLGQCLTEVPVPALRSDQAWDLLTVGRVFFLQPWSKNGTVPHPAPISARVSDSHPWSNIIVLAF